MVQYQRLLQLSLLVVLVITSATSRYATVRADGSAGSATVRTQCATSIKTPDAPVRGPLAAVVGTKLVDTVFNFITDTPLGKLIAGQEAYTCIANMNGTMLGNTLLDRLKTPTCSPFNNITSVPFVKYGLEMLTANASAAPSFTDVLKYMKTIPNDDMEKFCSLYTKSSVPCIVSELLPTLSVIRSRYSNGCCEDWNDEVLADFGYTISGQLTKIAQLLGDVMCATQTPGVNGLGSQQCGTTWLQTLLTKTDTASFAATVLRNLQVPTNQMCLRAEGKSYTDINNNSVPSSESTPSGCVITLDRITSWMYGLPLTKKSELFDVKSLLEEDKCLQGSELFPTIKYLLPALALDEVEVYFNKSCVHLPMQFGDKCSYSRPALLVEWENEPQPVLNSATPDPGPSTSDTNSSPKPTTVSPAAPASSSSVLWRMTSRSVVLHLLAFALVAL